MEEENRLPEESATDWVELLCAILSYGLAFCYLSWISERSFILFAAGFIALTEVLDRNKPRSPESWLLLGCLLAALTGRLFGRFDVWGEEESLLICHFFAVWWAVSRAGTLTGEPCGRFLPADAVLALFYYPFRYFFLRPLIFWRAGKGRSISGYAILALVVSVPLFFTALSTLLSADEGFRLMTESFFRLVPEDELFILRLVFSIPVGQYFFGLIAGSAREKTETASLREQKLCEGLASLKKVPCGVWTGIASAFVLLYAVFIAIQFRYLFGAFTGTLPEGFIVSQYAREGFFELCRVMALNFALLWLIRRTSVKPPRENTPALAVSLAVVAASLLFAAVALSKLWLYISTFGFTPLRLQSLWLVCVLACGTVTWAVSMLTGKRLFRPWCLVSALSLAALTLI